MDKKPSTPPPGKTLRGTCAWCFKSYATDNAGAITTRHGWREIGGRKAGEYGRVFHAGDCPGMSYPPYEISAAGTSARLLTELSGIKTCAKELERLATRPALVATKSYDIRLGSYRTTEVAVGVRLLDGEDISIEVPTAYSYSRDLDFSYSSAHYSAVHGQEFMKAEYERDAAMCSAKIKAWVLAPLDEYATPKPAVHYRPDPKKRLPWCGSKSWGIKISEVADEVTCTRCVRSLASIRAEHAKIEIEKADARRVFEWLKANGGYATAKTLKAALGLDAKALNRALEYCGWRSCLSPGERVESNGASPAKYHALYNAPETPTS